MTVCICAALLAAAAAIDPAAEAKALLADQAAAWNRGDLEGYMAGYWRSPKLSFFSGATDTRGWEPTLLRYRKRYQGEGSAMGKVEFSEIDAMPLGDDAAFVRGRWHLAFNDRAGAGGLFTLLLRRIDGVLRVVHDHSSGGDDPVAIPQEPGSLTFVNDKRQPELLRLADLLPMVVTAAWAERGEKRVLRGAPLDRVLAARGFSSGPMGGKAPADKRPGWKRAVIASAPDGFQAIFSAAELFESMGGTRALVVWEIDGKPVGDSAGPLRLIVLTDKEPTRSVRNLDRLELVDVRKLAAKR